MEVDHRGRSLKAQMKRANRAKVPLVAVVGPDEVSAARVSVKKMEDGSVLSVPLTLDALSQAASDHTS